MASVQERDFAFHEKRRDTDHESFLSHKRMRWLKVATFLCVAAFATYFLIDVEPRHNGGSWYGYTLGTIGLLLIVWLSLLGIRKRNMTRGRWSLKAWTSAHVYLGLALIVIGTLHTGFQLGWNVHTLAWGLMMLVIGSGIYGVVVYSVLPAALSNNAREMTRAQMVEALEAIDRQLDSAAQPLERARADLVIAALEEDVFAPGVVARLTGRYPGCRTTWALQNFGVGMNPNETEDRVRTLLGRRKAQLDQIRRAMKIRARLEVWLYIHIPATIALLAALTAHVISVFYYW
ncbi:hypothetical protein U4960_15475 [Altererythrobacter sp. H2]|uniref:hypothetical protein n=1 Tax=Altererythrobacter sp. H2 TaxID=3108391 RepID=UPI002B4BD4E8|nr:hypothetical protein [Altererythrobacter sp. H2]WRK95654.1 hypothetical protein U4960_15475 [Altererythrobacter sp. H2]